jgi:hypothetical protein
MFLMTLCFLLLFALALMAVVDIHRAQPDPSAPVADRTLFVNREGQVVEKDDPSAIRKIAVAGQPVERANVTEFGLTVTEGRLTYSGDTSQPAAQEPASTAQEAPAEPASTAQAPTGTASTEGTPEQPTGTEAPTEDAKAEAIASPEGNEGNEARSTRKR